jgi:integrase/recombinase XerD
MSDDASAQSASAHLSTHSLLTPTLTAWQYYLEDQGQSLNTIKAFTADVRLLASYLPPDRPIGLISTNELNNFFIWMQRGRGVPCSPKTLARRITSVKAFFRWLHGRGVLLVDPAEKVVQKSVLSPLPAVLTPGELKLAMDAANRPRAAQKPDARPAALFTLIVQTGIKKSECLALRLNHIDLETPGGPILFIRYTSPGYRYKERKIPLTQEWIEIYQEYSAQYPPQDKLFPWSPRRLEYLLEDVSNEAGLEKHISFEMCRWTSALVDWRSGMERDKIRQKLGISKIQWREVRMKLKRLAAETPQE